MNESIVLCYHALSQTWPADMSTTPERFARQLESLVSRGYKGVTFSEAVASRARRRVFAVTFDDAYRSVIELGLPILERLGLPATVFAPTDFIGLDRPMSWAGIERWLGGPHEQELMPMSWPQLQRLAAAGWEIGSHTGAHPHLTQIDDETLTNELTRSKAACEEHLGYCDSVAYPYGDVDARVAAATASAGYRTAATLGDTYRLGEALLWPRIGVYHRDHYLRFQLKLRHGPLKHALERMRRRVVDR